MKYGNRIRFKELITNKQYRAIIILVFYFFFFAILVIGARASLNKKSTISEEVKQKTSVRQIKGFSNIKSANFNYKYTLNIDDEMYIYEGKKYDNKDSYTLTVGKDIKNYVQVDDFSFEIKNKEKVLTDKPIYYLDFFDAALLEKIIENSSLKGDGVYSIDNIILNKLLNLQLGVSNKLENDIMLSYVDGNVTRIDINYTNFINSINKNIKKVLLTLEYKDFGQVLDFDVQSDN